MQLKPVTVATSAYGADRVRAHGQEQFIALVARAGAASVEIRHELFPTPTPDLNALRAVIDEQALFAIYYSPDLPRAIEFPLVGDDLEAVTRQYVTMPASA